MVPAENVHVSPCVPKTATVNTLVRFQPGCQDHRDHRYQGVPDKQDDTVTQAYSRFIPSRIVAAPCNEMVPVGKQLPARVPSVTTPRTL
jgi:hypothetical protein